MFSRSGKSTISQYTAFTKKHKTHRLDHVAAKETEDVDLDEKDELQVMMGEKAMEIVDQM